MAKVERILATGGLCGAARTVQIAAMQRPEATLVNADRNIPTAAKWLGFSGALPFVAGALAALPVAEAWRPLGLAVLVDYGAIILSFMGGVHWGVAMLRGADDQTRFYVSVLPALLALPAALIGGVAGLLLLAAGFAALLVYDERETRAGRLPGWYPKLRRPLTAIVVLSLVAGAAATRL